MLQTKWDSLWNIIPDINSCYRILKKLISPNISTILLGTFVKGRHRFISRPCLHLIKECFIMITLGTENFCSLSVFVSLRGFDNISIVSIIIKHLYNVPFLFLNNVRVRTRTTFSYPLIRFILYFSECDDQQVVTLRTELKSLLNECGRRWTSRRSFWCWHCASVTKTRFLMFLRQIQFNPAEI